MPSYNYKCDECGHVESHVCKIAERHQHEVECPKCGKAKLHQFFKPKSTPSLLVKSDRGDGNHKLPEGYKDVLKEIKRGSGRKSTIGQYI